MEENNSQIVIYQTESGETKLDVRFQNETVWLTQKLMAELLQTTPQNITIHLKNIFEEGELEEKATCKDFLQVQIEGKRKVGFYSWDLDCLECIVSDLQQSPKDKDVAERIVKKIEEGYRFIKEK